jgi:hypothetical protein
MVLSGAKGLWQGGSGNLTVAVANLTIAVYGRVAVAVAVFMVLWRLLNGLRRFGGTEPALGGAVWLSVGGSGCG